MANVSGHEAVRRRTESAPERVDRWRAGAENVRQVARWSFGSPPPDNSSKMDRSGRSPGQLSRDRGVHRRHGLFRTATGQIGLAVRRTEFHISHFSDWWHWRRENVSQRQPPVHLKSLLAPPMILHRSRGPLPTKLLSVKVDDNQRDRDRSTKKASDGISRGLRMRINNCHGRCERVGKKSLNGFPSIRARALRPGSSVEGDHVPFRPKTCSRNRPQAIAGWTGLRIGQAWLAADCGRASTRCSRTPRERGSWAPARR
jgi:hypothetical protein